MTVAEGRIIVVAGATGLQGRAVTRHLPKDGWRVRALTRNPASEQARALAASGAEVVRGDMDDAASLRPIIAGAYGVYSVQNPFIAGPEAEVRQERTVADIATASGVQHLVYGSAGTGKTHLAAAIANDVLGRAQPVLFVVVPDLLDHLRATFGPDSTVSFDTRFEQVRTTPLLILDDLGTESATPWAREKLYQLLNHRYNLRLAKPGRRRCGPCASVTRRSR